MKRKIIIPVICAIVLCGIVAGLVLSGTGDKPKLSSLNEEKLLAVLSDYGVTVPEELEGIDVREAVKRFEKDPDTPVVLNWSVLCDFSEDVRIAVKKYYAGLSELDEDEVMQILADNGVSIPEGFEWESIHNMISVLEEDPDHPAVYSNPIAIDFFDELREVVKEYYGII